MVDQVGQPMELSWATTWAVVVALWAKDNTYIVWYMHVRISAYAHMIYAAYMPSSCGLWGAGRGKLVCVLLCIVRCIYNIHIYVYGVCVHSAYGYGDVHMDIWAYVICSHRIGALWQWCAVEVAAAFPGAGSCSVSCWPWAMQNAE
jgi:hypothetical protein